MMNRYNETGTIINFSAPLLMIMVLCIALMENGCSILSVN